MKTDGGTIPAQTFKRLPGYYNILALLLEEGAVNVSSPSIARALALNEVQVRKDLASVSKSGGKPRTGYNVQELLRSIGRCLGYYNANDAVLVGAGHLGRALLSYDGFKEYGLRILAAFDVNRDIIGKETGGKPVLPMDGLRAFCEENNIRIGIITVPEKAAQQVCDTLVSSGIQAVWNFAPTHLTVPDDIFIHNENMALSLSLLSRHLTEKNPPPG